MKIRQVTTWLGVFCLLSVLALAQTAPFALMPTVRQQFLDPNGAPLAGGQVFFYAAGTSNALATYTDSSGTIQNTNPVQLDSGGFATIWLGPALYDVLVTDSGSVQQYKVFNVSDPGQLLYTKAVMLSPTGAALQTIIGPLAANYFQGITPHFTSPGVRVNLLDPLFTLDTATNPPTVTVTPPSAPGRNYTWPDPGQATSNVVLSPGSTTNTLDCTQTGLTCVRKAYAFFEGASCNNTAANMGWDTFGANSPTPICLPGTNVVKGVLAFPSAATPVQTNTGTGVAATTCTLTYPATTVTGHLLVALIAVDTSRTISGVTDGTNAYTKAANVTSGTFDNEIWYFNGNSTTMTAGTTLTATLSAAGNCAMRWREYDAVLTSGMLDKTSTSSGTGTAVSTGTTAGTAQNVELVIASMVAATNPTVVAQNGWTAHGTVLQGTNVTLASEALIQQATATQSATFSLSSSQVWGAVIATFKANVAATAHAQRTWRLPKDFRTTPTVNLPVDWQTPAPPTGTVNVVLGGAVICTSIGGTDDPVFPAATTATVAVNTTAANIINDTPLNALTSTGCAATNLMHVDLQRQRYNASDTYEGFVYVNGAGLEYGITQ